MNTYVAVRQLLSPDPMARLNGGVEGGVGVKKLMKHPFFAGIDWGVRTRDVFFRASFNDRTVFAFSSLISLSIDLSGYPSC